MITSKQRAFLRGKANGLSSLTQIGKGGVTAAVIAQADALLSAHELVKLSVLETAGLSAREACDELCHALNALPVQVIGNKLVLYRKHPENPKWDL